MRIEASNQRFVAGGTEYEWHGGLGAIFKSHEYGVRVGDVRMIGDVLFHAAYVWPRGWLRKPEICWSVPNPTFDLVSEIHQAILK